MDVVRRPKEAFLMGPEFSSTNLDRAGHFGPFHGSNRRRSGKQLITLDLNHFGFRGQRGGENEEKWKQRGVKRGYSRARANLNGGELDCENTWGTHKGSHKEGVLSQGQPKWWRAGQRTFSPQ